MFERLLLKEFGRFVETEIDLDRTTLVVGGNESGKTTIVDAISSSLAPASVDTSRYGESAAARLDGQQTLANDNDLHLLHVLPERGAQFAAEDRGAIDARLRAGLVGLRAVTNQLAAMAADDPNSPHNRECAQLRNDLKDLAKQWDEAWERRCTLLESAPREAERLSLEIETLDSQLVHQRERAALLAAQLEDERERARLCAHRTRLEERLELLRAQRADRAALADLIDLSDADLAQIDALQDELDAHLAQIASIEARQADGRGRLGDIAVEIDEARARQPLTKRAAERATATRLRLDNFFRQPKQVERHVWRGGRVVAAVAFFSVALVSAALLAGTVHFVGLGVGMMLGTFSLALGRQTIREDDDDAAVSFLAQLCAEWNRETALPQLNAATPADVVAFCNEQIDDYQRLTNTLDQRVTYKTRVEEEMAHILERSHNMLLTTLPPRQAAVDSWLSEHDTESREQYSERLRLKKSLEARLVERCETRNIPNDDALLPTLEDELTREINLLNRQVLDAPRTDAELDAMADEQRDAVALCEQLAQQRAELDRRRREAEPEDLSTRLHQIECERLRVESAIAELEADKQTAAAAHDMVAALANAPDLHRQLLNETLASLLASAGLDHWQVVIDDLTEEGVRLIDPRGHGGTLATVGSGTHDLLALACRLALAAEFGDALPLLVLEEPFARLDERRTRAALALLHSFQQRTGWQMVVIARTFPPESDLFTDAHVVDLDTI